MFAETVNKRRAGIFVCITSTAMIFIFLDINIIPKLQFTSVKHFNLKAEIGNSTTETQKASVEIPKAAPKIWKAITEVLKTTPEIQNATPGFVIDTSKLDRAGGYAHINALVVGGKLDFSKVASYPLEDEWLTPMDREILADEPVKNLTYVAHERFSTIQLVSLPKDGRMVVGDKVTVRVDVKDADGRQVYKGGHRVRVWMVQNGKIRRAAAAQVTDLRNGSFVASLPVLWNGTTEIRAALVRPREFRRIVLRLMSIMKLMNQNLAAYSFNKTEQVVLCSFVPVIPGYVEVCNLTDLNGGLPWYCGKPSKKGLQCHHWAWSSHSSFPQHYPMSETENTLMQKFWSINGREGLHLLKPSAFFNASEGKQLPQVLANPNCFPPQPRESWIDQTPSGFWENNAWHPLNGCPLPPLSANCYKDTDVIFMGDSNAVQMYQNLKMNLHCSELPDPKRSQHPNMLHVPFHCSSTQNRINMSWYPHAYPFFSGEGQWSDSRAKSPPSVILDTISGAVASRKRKYVVLIHLFIHFAQVHSHVFALHVRDTARAVRRLLERNPGVKVFIRGPHSVTGNRFQMTGDYHVQRSFSILRHEFRDMQDRVVLLNDWDMTVANENFNIHPSSHVLHTLVRMMTAYVCS